jgi:hypothetical protein
MRTLLISGIFVVFIIVQLLRGADGKRIIDGDGSGYYAYLTSVFIHRTIDFNTVYDYERSRRGLEYTGHYFHQYGDVRINKYFFGTALLITPFFLIALFYSIVIGMPPDGYNILFQYSVALAAAFYTAFGMVVINRLLKAYNISKKLSLFTILVLLFGTNLFYYTFLDPAFSHVYSFAAIALFLLASKHFFMNHSKRSLFIAAFALGIAGLIRPVNLVIVFALPFLSGSFAQLKEAAMHLIGNKKRLLTALVIFLVPLGMQLAFYYLQTGRFFFWSYRQEGFYFTDPAFFDFLFSYRKGFFIYTPLLLLLIPALIFLWKSSRYQFFSFSLFFLLLVYILSSWWNWYYGSSFGMRPMVDYYALFAIVLAFLLRKIENNRLVFPLVALFALAAISLNLLQTYQYHVRILHPDSMSKDKYWYVFLKTSPSYKNVLGGFPEPYYGSLERYERQNYFLDMEKRAVPWSFSGIAVAQDSFSGKQLAQLNNKLQYSPTLILEGENLRTASEPIYVQVQVSFREFEPDNALGAFLVYAASNKNNELLFYKAFKLKDMPDFKIGVWRAATFGFSVPAWNTDLHQVKVYIWNKELNDFQIDDFDVCFYFPPEKTTENL